MNLNEVKVLKRMTEIKAKGMPHLISHGQIVGNHHYIVMQRLGPSLQTIIIKSHDRLFSLRSTLQLGI